MICLERPSLDPPFATLQYPVSARGTAGATAAQAPILLVSARMNLAVLPGSTDRLHKTCTPCPPQATAQAELPRQSTLSFLSTHILP